jgi:hypothetical protein
MRWDSLVPVDAVLAEVEFVDRPLLALPQAVELVVAQQVGLAAVGGRLQRGIRGRREVLAGLEVLKRI